MLKTLFLILMLLEGLAATAKDYHVAKTGDNKNPGTMEKPFLTIQAAANVAQPGDCVIVQEGTYREKIIPPCGGNSVDNRITFQAANGEKVIIKGSEVVEKWEKYEGNVWKATIPNRLFGDYNPYLDVITGDWYQDYGFDHHTGEVYINGSSMYESETLDGVLNPIPNKLSIDKNAAKYTWFCEVDDEFTSIYANFQGANPDNELIEINVRNSCFYPEKTGINYITIRGFKMSQAATQWAPPTAEQIGLIGTNWSKGWIIENNIITDSKCSGITLGKNRRTGHNMKDKGRCIDGTSAYNEMILRVVNDGWSKDIVGSHIIRNNIIFNCEQTGICGSMGAIFSEVSGNHIYNIWRKRQFGGAEIAGIKFHAPVDVTISNNCIHHAYRGLWMDWMTQGTRISSNLCYENEFADLFTEVNHGPYVVDNNIFLSGLRSISSGGAYVHNLIAGVIMLKTTDTRYTPYFYPHSVDLKGFANITIGDDRYYNNLFVPGDFLLRETWPSVYKHGLASYDSFNTCKLVVAAGNLYYNNARPLKSESKFVLVNDSVAKVKLIAENEGIFLEFDLSKPFISPETYLVTSDLLGITEISQTGFENPNSTPIVIDEDYYGHKRKSKNPVPGPFTDINESKMRLKVWIWNH